ncbi:MAG: hypothetical protein GF353_15520 [Candidatus Lokiarchaeota archaeon]|nr:hypothetical protein [Candidatus Lokiarchaeota archaeon]
MIPLVIDSNIFFSAMYNDSGLERKILELSIEEKIHLFAPTVFKEEILRNLIDKMGYNKEYISELLQKYNIIDVPHENYNKFLEKAKDLIIHKEDYPFIAVSLYLKCPIWSGNTRHFEQLKESKEIIWLTSSELIEYLREKGIVL